MGGAAHKALSCLLSLLRPYGLCVAWASQAFFLPPSSFLSLIPSSFFVLVSPFVRVCACIPCESKEEDAQGGG